MRPRERAVLQDICDSRGIPYVPLDGFMEDAGAAARLPHDQHWNREGHAIAARAIDGFLQSLGVFPATGPDAPVPSATPPAESRDVAR
jgi:hypothetical protein